MSGLKAINWMKENANPRFVARRTAPPVRPQGLDPWEVFELVRDIRDPEYPNTLEELSVVQPELIAIDGSRVQVQVVPTIPQCSMAQTIALMVRVKLARTLAPSWRVEVIIQQGSHLN
jgi:metal-sulfur cluster biosynthetic enzyme